MITLSNNIIINERIEFDEFINFLEKYYSIKMKKKINLIKEFTVKHNRNNAYPDLKLYYKEYISGHDYKVPLNYEEIFNLLSIYAHNLGLELVSFKYEGEIKRTSFNPNDDISIITGVWLNMQERSLIKKLFRR